MKSYKIKLTMIDLETPVWRRIVLPAGITFNRLHETIQHVTNFESTVTDNPNHFFEIQVDGLVITDNPILREKYKDSKTLAPKNPTRVKIDAYLEKHKQLMYDYDSGDGWRIQIDLEEIVEDYHFGFPTLLDGEGDAPPEDVGGPPGFASFLKVMKNPAHPEHDHLTQWASGTQFKPYDKESINNVLKSLKFKKTEWDFIHHKNYAIISDPYRESEVSTEKAKEVSKPKSEKKAQQSVAEPNDLQKEVALYIHAMTNLYGMVQAAQVVSLYNEQNNQRLTVEDINEMIETTCIGSQLQEQSIHFKEGIFLGPKLAGIVPEEFVREAMDKPYYEPRKEELLRYAVPGYYEQTPEIQQLEKLFQQEQIPQLQIDRMMHFFMEGLSAWHANFMEVIGRLMAQAGPLPEESVKQIVPVAINVANAVRLIENRGHTPNELHGLERKQVQPLFKQPEEKTVKVGRNDPCPCGSGKKYKKCCGR